MPDESTMHVAGGNARAIARALRHVDTMPLKQLCAQIYREQYNEWRRWEANLDWHDTMRGRYGLFGGTIAPEQSAETLPLWQCAQATPEHYKDTPMATKDNGLLFPLGQIVATPGALSAFEEAEEEPLDYLCRHGLGDWEECGAEDMARNHEALTQDLRIFSVYTLSTGVKIWLITEHNRSYTTILLPSEY
jgi:hypothetical protein